MITEFPEKNRFHLIFGEFKGVDREKSAVFKELTQSFRTYGLCDQGEKKKKCAKSRQTKSPKPSRTPLRTFKRFNPWSPGVERNILFLYNI